MLYYTIKPINTDILTPTKFISYKDQQMYNISFTLFLALE